MSAAVSSAGREKNLRFRFSIDRGGSFTDVYCEAYDITSKGDCTQHVLKLLSEDPSNYSDAPTEGIRRLLEKVTGAPHPRSFLVETTQIDSIRMGTTVATNALLERNGERVALVTTAGFADLQVIGNQSRPKIFDLEIKRPELLYEHVVEINERVSLVKEGEDHGVGNSENTVVVGISHEKLIVSKEPDMAEVKARLTEILLLGIKSIAIVFLHSYTFPNHEKLVKAMAEEMGFEQISLSSEVMPMVRMVPRGCTTCVDAYLTPVIKRYLNSFSKGFDSNLMRNVQVSFMQSDGGLTPMDNFFGNRAILSGPAGGVVGYAKTSYCGTPVIGFDMGGTSTDVSRFAGTYEHVFESTTAGVTIQLDINTVAAGGGSRLFFRNGLFIVGPESSGAHPGPVCYRKGGPLAVTDANVLLGRIQPHLFPAIFGVGENEVLDLNGTREAFEKLTEEINSYNAAVSQEAPSDAATPSKVYTADEVAFGFIRVANEAMARPIRNLTTMKGFDVTKHHLSTFGGAGPQHCCAIAKSLGMSKVYVHRYAGILSAYGLSLADIVVEKQEPFSGADISSEATLSVALDRLHVLESEARAELMLQGFSNSTISCVRYLNCRYQGTDTSMMTTIAEGGRNSHTHSSTPIKASISCVGTTHSSIAEYSKILVSEWLGTAAVGSYNNSLASSYEKTFVENYRREFGFELVGRKVLVDDVRVRSVGKGSFNDQNTTIEAGASGASKSAESSSVGSHVPPPVPSEVVSVYFDGQRVSTPVFYLDRLIAGQEVSGPAIIVQNVATVIVDPACHAVITAEGDIEIIIDESEHKVVTAALDPIYLSIFSHRFMGIAEQMGRTLQRTSISVNIKERLDFSCALFDPSGGLVANAPHLPVHLGAMSDAVRYQRKYWGDNILEGDVLVSNHPQLAGGSHLPDITVITPIFIEKKIAFFVASRGHHADVGGIAPGSMPPLSKTLAEEGAAIIAFKLVEHGMFQESGISELLLAPGNLPNNFGTRNLSDNISDLKAQVAANCKGAALMQELVAEYGLSVVQAYMVHIQNCAEAAVRDMLRSFSLKEGMAENDFVTAEDYLDDGTLIKLTVHIDRQAGSAIFDFTGTGPEIYGNLNAPPAVTASAIIYCLRCLLPSSDIPLNQGCLAPIEIRIPKNTVLNPSSEAAVVGGNVTTSQRVTDVVLKAFRACAASQGCMNNLTFGDSTMGYYETIAGGAGAGPSWHGCSAVHTHMTNTRITDPEILERRYPVLLREFGVRKDSGGAGWFRGGDGAIRKLEFTKPLTVSILSERRAFQPYGMKGGDPGSRGINILTLKSDQRTISLGGKNTVHVLPGDVLTIFTPGGGGFGTSLPDDVTAVINKKSEVAPVMTMTSGSLNQYTLNQESV